MPGVRFSSRPFTRRELALNPYEVALIEVLRSFDQVAERPWRDLVIVVGEAIDQGRVRPDVVAAAVMAEHDRAARARWKELRDALVFAESA